MFRSRYTSWDGTQRIRLSPSQVFEKLAEYLSFTDDLQQAMDWLLRQGMEWEGAKVVGLDEILEQLREEMRKRYREFNLDHSLDKIREKLGEIVDLERSTLEERSGDAEIRRKIEFLDRLPLRTSEAIEKLRDYRFEDADAERDFESLLDELGNVRDLEEFQRRYGDLFHGRESLGYEQAVELMREMERLKKLEEDLFSGNLESLNPEDLREFLGDRTAEDVRTLQQIMKMISESGYVTAQGGRQRLSPKGVRKIGQLALRDIYQNLLRDRAGTHSTDRRGPADVRPDETRPYQYGDPLHLDLVGTLKKALARKARTPLAIEPSDFEIYRTDANTTTSTVLLLDMSWSMSWEGRFAAAKKVAMALESLLRSKFPRDYFGMVGFFTRAVELKLKDLPEASWNMGDPFTNLQDGLRLAGELLARHPSRNQNVIVITDGQPTAYFSRGRLYCEWPLSFGGI
ncbi:MAG: VWA domain-containing protein, partial [Candidatus Binatia bacterium]